MGIHEKYCRYFQISINNFPSSKIIVILSILIEQIPQLCLNIVSSNILKLFLKTNTINKREIEELIFYKISLLPYTNIANYSQQNSYLLPKIFFIIIIIFFLLMFFVMIYLIQTDKIVNCCQQKSEGVNTKRFRNLFFRFFVFFYELLLFRILSLWILLVCVNLLIYFNDNKIQYILSFAGMFVLIIYIPTLYYYYNHTFFYLNIINSQNQYPFDEFSSKLEIIFLIHKLILALAFNYLNKDNTEFHCFFFSLLAIILTFGIIIKQILNLFYFYSSYLFIRNKCINSFRLFLLIFQVFLIIGHLLLDEVNITNMGVTYILTSLVLSVCLILFIVKANFDKISFGDNIYNHLLMIIEKTNTDINYANPIVSNLFLSHCDQCKCTENCLLCKYYQNLDNNIIDLIKIIYDKYDKKTKTSDELFKAQIISCFLKINQSQNKFLLNIFYSATITYHLKHNPTLGMNLCYYYRKYLQSYYNNASQVDSLLMLENQINNIKQVILTFKDIIYCEDEKPSFFIENAKAILNLKRKLKPNKLKISQYDKTNIYQIMIIKFIYEILFKNKETAFSTISFNAEFITEHFENDKFFLLKYEIKNGQFIIIQTGKEYCQLGGTSFINLFPFGWIAEKYLIEALEKNDSNNIFEFPIVNYKQPEYVSSFKMNYKVFPSIELKIFLIIGFYQINYSNTVITMYDKITKKENIITFNYSLKEYLIFILQI